MGAVALALAASVSWGISDFLGGLKSRSLNLLTVLVASQAMGLLLAAAIVAARAEPPPPGQDAVFACLSGAAGVAGLAAFYRGLAVGAMSVVAPISATAAVLPLAVGVASGDRPSAVQAIGVVLAITGVAVASRELPAPGGSRVAAGVGLALLSALGFGSFFVAMDAASDADLFWAVLMNRLTSVSLLLAVALAVRPPLPERLSDARSLALIGTMDIGANALFGAASTKGLVSLVAVVASLYPVVTVLLARLVLRERIRPAQAGGIGTVLAGVALISAG